MKRIFSVFIFFAIIISISSCYKDENRIGMYSDEFYLRHKGADLPVWIRGSKNAKTFIIFLHGGPFDTGIENAVYKHFEPLLDDYAIVFFDQRGGGYTHGQQSVNLNENQFVEDVEVLYKLIRDKYSSADNFFLMGHSYGGYLGTAVLAKGDNQNLFKGWIELAGNHNFPLNILLSREFSIDYIEKKQAEGISSKEWDERLEALKNTPAVSNLNQMRIINGIAFQVASELNEGESTFNPPPWSYVFSSPIGAGVDQHNTEKVLDIIINGNLNPEMESIFLPSLLIYGGEDPIVLIGTGENGIEYLGTPIEDKKIVILEKSGHSLWEYESDKFFSEIKTFISKYE